MRGDNDSRHGLVLLQLTECIAEVLGLAIDIRLRDLIEVRVDRHKGDAAKTGDAMWLVGLIGEALREVSDASPAVQTVIVIAVHRAGRNPCRVDRLHHAVEICPLVVVISFGDLIADKQEHLGTIPGDLF